VERRRAASPYLISLRISRSSFAIFFGSTEGTAGAAGTATGAERAAAAGAAAGADAAFFGEPSNPPAEISASIFFFAPEIVKPSS